MEKEQLSEALDAYSTALEYTEKAYGVQSVESAPLYHKFGTVLMTVTSADAEEGFSKTLVSAMERAMDEGEDKKISKADLEEEAQQHVQSFDEAWEALEIARVIYEKAGDMASVARVRMSLGDACLDVEEYEDAAKEFTEAARLRRELEKDSRGTTEALFMSALCYQMTGAREECVKAFEEARDMLARLMDKCQDKEELEEMRVLHEDVDEKVKQVKQDDFWTEQKGEEQEEEEEAQDNANDNGDRKRGMDGGDVVEEDKEEGGDEAQKKRKLEEEEEKK